MILGVVEFAVAVVVVIMVALDWMVLILVVEALVLDMVVAGVIVKLDKEDIVESELVRH